MVLPDSDQFIRKTIRDLDFSLRECDLEDETIHSSLAARIRKMPGPSPRIISLVGGAASGKSTLARSIADDLENAATVSTDDFVLGSRAFRSLYRDFEGSDPLEKYDFELMRRKIETIKALKPGQSECLPQYDEATGVGINIDYDPKTGVILKKYINSCDRQIGPLAFLIVEGDFQTLERPDLIIFFHVPDEVRLQNRIRRDSRERGARDDRIVAGNFLRRQKLQHVPHTLPTARAADLIVTVTPEIRDEGYSYNYSLWGKSDHHPR